MDTNSQRPKEREGVLSSLNVAIEGLNLAKEVAGIAPAKAAFGSVSILLTMVRVRFLQFCNMDFGFTCIQDSMINKRDYVELGLGCIDICTAIEQGMSGKKPDDLSPSVCEAINQFTKWVKPMIHTLDGSLTMHLFAELWEKSGRRSTNGMNGTQSLVFSTRRMTRKRSPLGSWTSSGSSRFSTCVWPYLCLVATNCSLSDRAGHEHPHNRFRHSARCVEDPGGD